LPPAPVGGGDEVVIGLILGLGWDGPDPDRTPIPGIVLLVFVAIVVGIPLALTIISFISQRKAEARKPMSERMMEEGERQGR
jgi:hypothetical protein